MRIVALPSSSSSPLAVIRTKAIYNVCKEPSPRQQQQQQQQQQQEQMTCTTMTTKRLYRWIFSGTFCLRPVGPSLIEFRQRRVALTVIGGGRGRSAAPRWTTFMLLGRHLTRLLSSSKAYRLTQQQQQTVSWVRWWADAVIILLTSY